VQKYGSSLSMLVNHVEKGAIYIINYLNLIPEQRPHPLRRRKAGVLLDELDLCPVLSASS